MEFMYAKPIQRQVEKQDPATEKQIRLLEIIARNVGFRVNAKNITKDKASNVIDQLKILDKSINGSSSTRDLEQKKREHDIKLGMAKKLVFQKWTTENREIDKQSENVFIREVIYINDVLNKIDPEITFKQVA